MADSTFDEIFERIASNPDIIEKISSITKGISQDSSYDSLPKIMEAIAPILEGNESDKKSEKADTSPTKNTTNDLSAPLLKLSEKITKNSKLLIALKPYLSRERCEIIDTVVKFAQVGDLMKLVK